MNTDELQRAIVGLQASHPNLGIDGLRPVGAICETDAQHLAYGLKDHGEAIAACRMWLAACPRTKNARTTHDTYSYKHEVEAVTGYWIPHLAFLVAVQLSGLTMTPNPDRRWAGRLPLGTKRPGGIPT